jgi:hypothetical protein
MFVGVDSVDQHGIGVVNLRLGETRDIVVHYYNDGSANARTSMRTNGRAP